MSSPELSSLPGLITKEVVQGNVLAGDDLDLEGLKKWYFEEENAFYESSSSSCEVDPWYEYMCYVNKKLTTTVIKKIKHKVKKILFVGPGSGKEVYFYKDVLKNADIYFLESSKKFQLALLKKFPNSRNIQPKYNGDIEIENNFYDIIFFYSVLHHIPNVSKLLMEASRITKKNGLVIIREPCSSMGIWNKERSSTPNERGISKKIMLKYAKKAKLNSIKKPVPILLEPINKFINRNKLYRYINFKFLYLIDKCISKLVSIQDIYWRDKFWKKIGPSSYYYFFEKS